MKRNILVITSLLLLGFLVYKLFAPTKPQWDTSAETRIIYSGPGLMEIDFSYVPDFQIWGDGTIIWVEKSPNGSRQVYQGKLTEKQIIDILQSFIDSGMFNLLSNPRNNDHVCAYMGADNDLHVELLKAHRRTLIRKSDEPVCNLARYLASGTDLEGYIYKPKIGIVYPIPLEFSDSYSIEEWHLSTLPFDFDAAVQASGQFKIEGQALELIWEFVNQYPDPVVTYQGINYRIGVIIPRLSPY